MMPYNKTDDMKLSTLDENVPEAEGFGSTMPNYFILSSDKFFNNKAPWRVNKSLYGLLSQDHLILCFNRRSFDSLDSFAGKQMFKSIRWEMSQRFFKHRVLILCGKDCSLAPVLVVDYGHQFDTVVLVDNPYPKEMFNVLVEKCTVHSFYTKPHLEVSVIFHEKGLQQYVKTVFPPQFSARLANEIAAVLTYQDYGLNFLSGWPSIYKWLD